MFAVKKLIAKRLESCFPIVFFKFISPSKEKLFVSATSTFAPLFFSISVTLSFSLNEIFQNGILSPLLVSSFIENPKPTDQVFSLLFSLEFGKSEIYRDMLKSHNLTAPQIAQKILDELNNV